MQETQETRIQSPGWEYPLEKRMATYPSILVWRIPRTEEPGGLQSMGSQRVGHNLVTTPPALSPLWRGFLGLLDVLNASLYVPRNTETHIHTHIMWQPWGWSWRVYTLWMMKRGSQKPRDLVPHLHRTEDLSNVIRLVKLQALNRAMFHQSKNLLIYIAKFYWDPTMFQHLC